jgi:hypothetical protein
MKCAAFYEGESERNMLVQILRRTSPYHIDITEDPISLLTTPDDQHCLLLFPCDGYQNVFPYVEENHNLYVRDEVLIVLRDLETVPCFSGLRAELDSSCSALPPVERLRLLFSKPEFEQVYFADLELLERVFIRIYEEHFGTPINDIAALHARIQTLDPARPQRSIRRLFRDYNLAFNKPRLSFQFFSRLDISGTAHPYVQRLVIALDELLTMPL